MPLVNWRGDEIPNRRWLCVRVPLAVTGRRRPARAAHDDIVNLARVGSPALSPDGARVAHTVRRTNWDDNAFDTDIWMVDVATRQARRITRARGRAVRPPWPDATRLAFVSIATASANVLSLDGGEARGRDHVERGRPNAFDLGARRRAHRLTQADAKPAAMKAV